MGKTSGVYSRRWAIEKHPHGRGEDTQKTLNMHKKLETPPRAWGRPVKYGYDDEDGGNTPTGVGKTSVISFSFNISQKHPHGRGEDL